MLFKTKDVRKGRKYDIKIHKSMIIPVDIHEINQKFAVTVQPKNKCKLESVYHLWLPFIDQPQSDIVFFAIINFRIYIILVSKQKTCNGYY